ENIIGVYCAPDKEGQKIDPLKEYALAQHLPVFQPASFKKPEVWEQLRSLKPDLGVMAYVTLFVPQEALNTPTHGTIQYHPSLLPWHKGPSSINWPIIFGERKTGLSVFWPDNGLDTGPILLQKEVEIGADDTLGSLYFDQLFPLGVEAMLEAIDLVKAGRAPKIPQDPKAGSYEGWCRAQDVRIDWSKPQRQVHDLIRGANPQPGAWTFHAGKMLQIFDAVKLAGAGTPAPGEVLEINDQGFNVATRDGPIQVLRVKPDDNKKMAAREYARIGDLKVGDRLT
ncbi:MAG: methionyl-tRNA formyltransferase, partial [Gammaproteobacteria bacterium]